MERRKLPQKKIQEHLPKKKDSRIQIWEGPSILSTQQKWKKQTNKQNNSVHHCGISEQQGKDKVLKASRSRTEMTKTQNGIRLQYHWLEDNSGYHLFSGKIILNLELYIQPHYQSSEGSSHLLGIYYAQ